MYVVLIIISLINVIIGEPRNNVCRTYDGYLSMDDSKDCFFSPSLYQSVPKVIEIYAGKSETHKVTTEDGYTLTIFRIPHDNPKGVILLHHPVSADSSVWTRQENSSSAFKYHRDGYDVWMPNNRGTRYSYTHRNLTAAQEKFWDFSFYEIAMFDHKTTIDYIRRKTGRKIIYFGHSMSVTTALIYAALRPEESRNSIQVMVMLAPISYMKYLTSPFNDLAYIMPGFQFINTLAEQYSIAGEYNSLFLQLFRSTAIAFPFKYLYTLFNSVLSGWTPAQFDPTFFNNMFCEYPSPLPWKIMYHFGQMIRSGRFQEYDYGARRNRRLYGTKVPPEYPVENITTPIYLVYSYNDSVSCPEDVDLLYKKLKPVAKPYGRMLVKGFNHADFHYGSERIPKIYEPIGKFLATLPNP